MSAACKSNCLKSQLFGKVLSHPIPLPDLPIRACSAIGWPAPVGSFKGVEYPVVCRNPFEICRSEPTLQPLLCTGQAEGIRAGDVPTPKVILDNKGPGIFDSAVTTITHFASTVHIVSRRLLKRKSISAMALCRGLMRGLEPHARARRISSPANRLQLEHRRIEADVFEH